MLLFSCHSANILCGSLVKSFNLFKLGNIVALYSNWIQHGIEVLFAISEIKLLKVIRFTFVNRKQQIWSINILPVHHYAVHNTNDIDNYHNNDDSNKV